MELLGRAWEVTSCDGTPQDGTLTITSTPPHAMWLQPWEDAMGAAPAADVLELDLEAGAIVRVRILRRATLTAADLAPLAALLDPDGGVPVGAQLVDASTRALSVLGDPAVPAVLPRLPAGTALVSAQLGRTAVRDLSALREQGALRVLDLEGCAAVSDLGAVRALRSLEVLKLAGTGVRDLAPIAGLSGLRVLTLPAQVDDLSVLGGLAALTELDVSRREIGDAQWLRGMVGLEVVDVSDTGLADLGVLGPAVRRLRADRTQIHALVARPFEAVSVTGIRAIRELAPAVQPALRELVLHGTGVTSLASLAGTPLRLLDVTHTDVADLAPLAGLADLHTLKLFSTKVTDLAPLAGLSALRDLDVFCTAVTNLSPLRKANLERVELRWSRVTDLAPLAHHRWTLRRLRLDAALLPQLRLLDGALLTELVIRDDGTPPDLAALTALPQLATLQLDHAYGGLPTLAALLKLPKLTRLIAPGLSPEACAALRKARPSLAV